MSAASKGPPPDYAGLQNPMAKIPLTALVKASRRPEVVAAMRAFYAEVDRDIARQPGTCWNKGECCQFGRFGHRLYVTALEVCYYLAGVDQGNRLKRFPCSRGEPQAAPLYAKRQGSVRADSPEPAMHRNGETCNTRTQNLQDACPHAYGGKCHVRDHRPLGCRVFFCDPNAQPWQGPLTEERLARLRTLHDELDVSYFYADWITVLQAIRNRTENIC